VGGNQSSVMAQGETQSLDVIAHGQIGESDTYLRTRLERGGKKCSFIAGSGDGESGKGERKTIGGLPDEEKVWKKGGKIGKLGEFFPNDGDARTWGKKRSRHFPARDGSK